MTEVGAVEDQILNLTKEVDDDDTGGGGGGGGGGDKDKNGRIPRKKQLIRDIKKFRPFLGDLIPTDNKLKKTKIKDLERLLAQCVSDSSGLGMNEQLDSITNPTPAATGPSHGASAGSAPLPQPNTGIRGGAESLYLANLGLVNVLEQISNQTAEYTGVVLDGWTDDIKRSREELTEILAAVYAENQTVCKQYLSATGIWGLFMISSASAHLKKAEDVDASPKESQDASGVGSPEV